ncbi:RNA ligase/cyclic nucleotide phosphodiesterase [Piptocephalis cylindrospora]|uniref:RNA ligase/cyclic nucleotide phosphodiesterase n=1 Tax=Piptocephalis cylindrospora TaxID=1907219 RepID=A0A4V1IY63_9FUNG|nr:RNA ligase/cyclic nucleotide phosphodiesterase [Piptocephalis cylindrospora]|eukprot:RKP13459.1 RNA ligase/cyclic nucleotide phosphodiesterase [Piptocephalis cylindrospora]
MTTLDEGTLPSPHITAWLVPPDEASISKLQSWLQKQHSASPTFQTHLTLLAPLPPGDKMIEVTRRLAKQTTPFMVHPTGVSTGPGYFENVMLKVEKTNGLDDLYEKLRKAFPGVQPSSASAFTPHLSLLYGLKDEEERQSAAKEVMNWSGWKESPWDGQASFLADRIVLIDCGGTTEDWNLIETISFQGTTT